MLAAEPHNRAEIDVIRAPPETKARQAAVAGADGAVNAMTVYQERLFCAGLFLLYLSALLVDASLSQAIVAYISEPAFASKLHTESAPWAASITWICLQHDVGIRFYLHVSTVLL